MYQNVKFWVVSLLEKKYHSECHSGREVLQSGACVGVIRVNGTVRGVPLFRDVRGFLGRIVFIWIARGVRFA